MNDVNSNIIFLPLDFNSLCTTEDGILKLTDYYLGYAFAEKNLKPYSGMEVTFYDDSWGSSDPNEFICLDATIETSNGSMYWQAKLKGEIYTSSNIPKRSYFNSFIGANTTIADGNTESNTQDTDPRNDKLNGISCFVFSPNSELPDFSKIIGLDIKDIPRFFKFEEIKKNNNQIENSNYVSDDTLVVRGGRNRVD